VSSATSPTSRPHPVRGAHQLEGVSLKTKAFALFLVAAAVAGCSSDPDEAAATNEEGQREITIGVTVPNALFMTTMVGADAGIFAEHGLDVTVEVLDGGPAATQALLSGDIDVLEGGLTEILTTYGTANQLVGFAETVSAPAYQFFGREGLDSWDDLADGELVGVSAVGGLDYAVTRYAMTEAGLDPDDYQYIASGGGTQRASALLAGTVGMTSTSPPGSYLLEQEGLEPIGELSEFLDTFPIEIYATTEATVDEDPELVSAIQESLVDIGEYIRGHRDETVEILQSYLEFPEEQREIYGRTVDYFAPYIAPEEISREGHELVVDFYSSEGQVNGEPEDVLNTLFTYWDGGN